MTDDSGRNPIDEYNASVSGRGGGSNTRFNLIVYSIMLIPAFGMIFYMYWYSVTLNPYVHPHIKDDAYAWPVGCSQKDLQSDNVDSFTHEYRIVPFNCGDIKYRVDDVAHKYGIASKRKTGKGGSHFFRIDNDIYELECYGKGIFTSNPYCEVINIEHNSYYQ